MTDHLPSKDLVAELRRYGDGLPGGLLLMRQAADEIERARRTAEYWKAEHLEANRLIESEWFQRVTYKQQLRAAQVLLRRCVAPLKVAVTDAESYDCVLDHDVWARLLDEVEAHIGAAQPPGDGQ